MSSRHCHYPRIAAALCAALACAAAFFGGPAHAAGLLIADGGFGGVLKIEEHRVSTTINNGIAVTEVTQVFRNTEDRQVEALYTFPVPKGASLSNFSMWINGKEMVGEVVEKERAREIYNSYKQQRRDPGLLEQVDYKTFEMRIFPIAPRAEQRLQVTYYQELDFDHNWATYVYPLATVTRDNIDQQVEGTFSLDLRMLSEIPLTGFKSPSHRDEFVFQNHDAGFHEASLELAGGSLARDVVLACQYERPQTGADLVCSRSDGPPNTTALSFLGLEDNKSQEDGYFMLTLTAGEELEAAAPPMNYVFVLDISGSMANDLKLDTSAGAVRAFVEQLGENERFELMTFNTNPDVLFNDLMPATPENLELALGYITMQRAGGGTRLDPALEVAYRYAERDPDRDLNIVILSDGMTDQASRRTLLTRADSAPVNARVFCVGVGNEVNRPLMQQLAGDAGGLAAFLSAGDDFSRQAEAFRRKLTRPAIEDVSIDFPESIVYDVVPEKAPNLYHGQPLRLYGRYRQAGPVAVVVKGSLAGRAFEQKLAFEFPETEQANPEIERMWAWHRIRRLERHGEKNGFEDAARQEIVRLGEGYSIATEYTSFLVLENNAEYQRWKIDRRNALRTTRDRTAQQALRDQLEAMRMAALDKLGPAREKVARNTQQQAAPVPSRTAPARSAPTPPPTTNRNQNIVVEPRRSGGGFSLGGGAIDPVSGSIVLGLAGVAYAAKRRKQS